MCRLYGFRANEATKVECTLVHAQNALLLQSRSDRSSTSHSDGWGIAFYGEDGRPELHRSECPAHEDVMFSATAERVMSRTVVAHVRRATVGVRSLANTHPYQCGRWVFAHNGTVTAFDRVSDRLRAETLPELQRHRRGTNDSEQAFLWLLSSITGPGVDLEKGCESLDIAAGRMADRVQQLAEWSAAAGAERAAVLNFLLTDGNVLMASCWNSDLYRVIRDGVRDCEICGTPHIEHDPSARYRAVVMASEPISHEEWEQVPECHLVAVDRGADCHLLAI